MARLSPVSFVTRLFCDQLLTYPVVSQCEIRKLYAARNEPGVHEAIDLAKSLERRRCGHHPDEYPEPLSTQECLRSMVDPKGTNQNKHRYVVASQDQEVRRMLRGIKGVPLIYIKRSVMVLEPMADESVQVRAKEERSKFRAEIKSAVGKRKRDDADDDDEKADKKDIDAADDQKKKKKKGHGPKGPNPLAVQKPKKPKADGQQSRKQEPTEAKEPSQEGTGKRKRRRRNKTATETGDQGEADNTATAEVTMTDA